MTLGALCAAAIEQSDNTAAISPECHWGACGSDEFRACPWRPSHTS